VIPYRIFMSDDAFIPPLPTRRQIAGKDNKIRYLETYAGLDRRVTSRFDEDRLLVECTKVAGYLVDRYKATSNVPIAENVRRDLYEDTKLPRTQRHEPAPPETQGLPERYVSRRMFRKAKNISSLAAAGLAVATALFSLDRMQRYRKENENLERRISQIAGEKSGAIQRIAELDRTVNEYESKIVPELKKRTSGIKRKTKRHSCIDF